MEEILHQLRWRIYHLLQSGFQSSSDSVGLNLMRSKLCVKHLRLFNHTDHAEADCG